MAVELKVPRVGESVAEVEIAEWRKSEGAWIDRDEIVAVIDTEKATVELPAPVSGVLTKILKQGGETASVGDIIGYMEEKEKAEKEPPKKKEPEREEGKEERERAPLRKAEAAETPRVMPAARRLLSEHDLKVEEVQATGPGNRLLKEDVIRHLGERAEGAERKEEAPRAEESDRPTVDRALKEQVVPMSPLRRRIAERLVQSQRSAALLTTFNEIDMSAILSLREKYRDVFQQKHGVKLGLMPFFVKAAIEALKFIPQLNAEIRGGSIVYHDYYDIGIAVGGGRGLVVPVLRDADRMSLAEIERAIGEFARRAQKNKLTPEELQGGTFTISNGGVYGSLLSTPIVNPPQSGVLGLHVVQDRPVARGGQIVIRPMMYVALTYDHRIVDGREAVTFLKKIKDLAEDPQRILLEI